MPLPTPLPPRPRTSHEHVANLMGIPARPFMADNDDELQEIKRKFITYVKALTLSGDDCQGPIDSELPIKRKNALPLTADGYPILPVPWNGSQYKKRELEELFILYVSQHYSMSLLCIIHPHALTEKHCTELATNGKSQSVPYLAISGQVSAFISHQYLPMGFQWRDPRNLHKDVLEGFFAHVVKRQIAHGAELAFRFKGVKGGRGDGVINPAAYPNNPTTLRRRRAKRGPATNPTPDPTTTAASAPDTEVGHSGNTNQATKKQSTKKKPEKSITTLASPVMTSPQPSVPAQPSYVYVNQQQMDFLQNAGIPLSQPVNGPNDGDPEYLVPHDLYARYITGQSVAAHQPTLDVECPIDPILLQEKGTATGNVDVPSQQAHPKPCSSASNPLGRRSRMTADDLAQQEAISANTQGKRQRARKKTTFDK